VKHYAVAEIEVTDPAWVREYIDDITAMVERRSTRARSTGPTGNGAVAELATSSCSSPART